MAASRRAVAAVVVVAGTVAACDALIGLTDYKHVPCAVDCDAATGEGGQVAEAGSDSSIDVNEAATDSKAEADASEASAVDAGGDVVEVDVGVEELEPTDLWAQWPMPNPEAGIAPEASTLLPNTMGYDAGADGGRATAYDLVTKLTWKRVAVSAASYDAGANICAGLGTGWHVPTRIQLVSLIDFTQVPTIDPATFPGTPSQGFWTSSPSPDGGSYWVVNFGTGLTSTAPGSAAWVLCVNSP